VMFVILAPLDLNMAVLILLLGILCYSSWKPILSQDKSIPSAYFAIMKLEKYQFVFRYR
jgi:hypothetical protein